jgi:hypothetical protein
MINAASLDSVSPARLARMLEIEHIPGTSAWSAEDAAAALRHQLNAPLLPDITSVPGAEPERLEALVRQPGGAAAGSLLEALLSPETPIELLEAIKAFARHVQKEETTPLHGVSGTIIYYAAIAAALLRGTKLSKLNQPQLRDGMTWAMEQQAAAPLHRLFQKAVASADSWASEQG